MRSKIIAAATLFITLSIPVYAEMMLFVGEDCSQCRELQKELTEKNINQDLTIYEIYHDKNNAALYLEKSKELNYKNARVPLLIDEQIWVEGKSSIMAYLEAQGMPQSTKLKKEDSENMNAILADANFDEKTTRELGLFIIILGVSMGLSVFGISRFRRRKK